MNNLYETGIRLWADWTEMWNGRPELALELVAPRFVLHLPLPAPFDTAGVTNPAAVARFVSDTRWEAANGFTLTEEIKVLIAAQASMLLLGLDLDSFPLMSLMP